MEAISHAGFDQCHVGATRATPIGRGCADISPPLNQRRRIVRILVNAVNTASAGGWGVFTGLLPALADVAKDDEITVLLPPGDSPLVMPDDARSVLLPQVRKGPRALWRLVDDFFRLRAIVRSLKPDVFFSITDLAPSRLDCPHVLLLHNPLVTYHLTRPQ